MPGSIEVLTRSMAGARLKSDIIVFTITRNRMPLGKPVSLSSSGTKKGINGEVSRVVSLH